MVDGRFIITGGGFLGLSFVLFIALKELPTLLQNATTPEGISAMYFLHMISAFIGVILLLIGIFKKSSA